MKSPPHLLRRAVERHGDGRLAEAEALYLHVLRAPSDNFDALHRLGIVRYQQRRYAPAPALIGAALEIDPESLPALQNQAAVSAPSAGTSKPWQTMIAPSPLNPLQELFSRGNVLV
jgi:tetratricopeptide (TPR) repeat protein